MSALEKTLKFLRLEIDSIVEEADEICAEKTTKRCVYDELITEIEGLAAKHAETTQKYIDTLEKADDVEVKCKQINEDTKKLRKITRKLKQHKPDPDGASDTKTKSMESAKVRMPQLPLPTFNGDILKFQSFWDQYRCAVHDSDRLQPVQKFVYLRESLKDAALAAIDGYEITEANYPIVIERLKERFGRTRLVIFALIKDLISMKLEGSTTKELRDFHDLLVSRIRSLEALKFDTKDSNVNMLLVPILEMKLRTDLLEEWEREITDMDDKKINVKFYFSYIEKQITAKEAMERSSRPQDHYDTGFEYSSTAALVSNQTSQQLGNLQPEQLQNRGHHQTGHFVYTPDYPSHSLVGNSYRPPPGLRQQTPETRSMRPPPPPRMPTYPNPRQGRIPPNQCAFCHNQHNMMDCQQLQNLHINDRWRWATDCRLCFNCLLPANSNHNAGCCRKPSCTVERCGKKHHRLLHYTDTHSYFGHSPQGERRLQSLLQSGLAILDSNGSRMIVRLLFDTGSERSYIRKGIVEALGLIKIGSPESLTVTTLGAKSTTQTMHNVRFDLLSRFDTSQRVTLQALAMDRICAPLDALSIDTIPYLNGFQLADNYPRGKATVDILVGQDHYYDIIHGGRCRRGPPGCPIALDSIFGWILCGNVNKDSPANISSMTASVREETIKVVSNQEMHDSLTRFWELEAIGVCTTPEKSLSDQDEIVMNFFLQTTTFDGTHYTVRIPWKPNVEQSRSNYNVAYKCLQSIEKQLLRNPEKIEAYTQAMKQYEIDGISELVPIEEQNPATVQVNYLSHHAVYREEKTTTKIRIVMNAALRSHDGLSLNDLIFPGPALQPNLFSVLIRFRNNRIGLIADIRKMFLQVKLDPRDQESHRYLWRDMNLAEPPKTYRMTRVTFGVNCSPFLAIATVQHHAKVQSGLFPEAASEILTNMYVDDIATGSDTPETAKILTNDLRALMSSGGFHLTKWASNSSEVMDSIPEAERNPAIAMSGNESRSLKTLGLTWNLEKDTLSPDISGIMDGVDNETMRSTVRLIAKLYDPLGWYGPFTITAKMLVQTIWIQQSRWDQTLDDSCVSKWRKWKTQVPKLMNFGIPRCLLEQDSKISSIELHGFSDASPLAYGCAVYVRMSYENGSTSSGLIMSKSRVAPLKRISLPRLELLGALICARLMKFVHESFRTPVKDVCLWTDSLVTYYWLMKPPQLLKQFVGNRVEEATSLWPPSKWRHCPGECNPGDMLTRGVNVEDLMKSEKWWHGPSWLRKSETEWPTPPRSNEPVDARPELRRQEETTMLLTQNPLQADVDRNVEQNQETSPHQKCDIDPTRYSRWTKLLRITAYVFIARDIFKRRRPKNIPITLKSEDLNLAEKYWINEVQNLHFQKTLDRLRNHSGKTQDQDNLLPLDPYIDPKSGTLKVGGRLQNSILPEQAKHQIILPQRHWISQLIIEYTHHHASHVGPENTHCLIRQKFWIIHGRQEVKRVLRDCRVCARYPRKAESQKMAPLPRERVTPDVAFSTVGIDFAGPLYLRCGRKSTRTTVKSYICLFTCATSRMIHLELCPDMSTSEFLKAFRRMTNRRGLCRTVFSDNALTFKATDRILRSRPSPEPELQLNDEELNEHFSREGIAWKFITERSPWQGGFYERMVRSVKFCLRRVLGRALLTYCEMNTVLTDIEASVNSRPLTVVSTDARDPEPLTPAHLAIGRPLRTLPDQSAENRLPPDASRRYVYMQRILESFWKRWTLEYLPLLTIRKKWTVEKPAAHVGNVVLVSDDKTPRGQWPMAIITEVLPGKDGLIRNVKVRTVKKRILTRPVQRLYLLEEAAAESESATK